MVKVKKLKKKKQYTDINSLICDLFINVFISLPLKSELVHKPKSQ